jgi:hypothetical protein
MLFGFWRTIGTVIALVLLIIFNLIIRATSRPADAVVNLTQVCTIVIVASA